MKIGVIGCGGIAGAHMARLAQIKDVEFVGLCDVVEEKANKASQTYGGKVFKDFRKMLEEVKMDACFICVPPFAHEGQELACIDKNIPFFVEKPIDLSLDGPKEIARKVREKGLITGVGYVLRYFDVVDKAKEILAKEKIGLVRGRYFGCVPAGGKGWYIKRSQSGGQLIEQATHTVNLMMHLAGDITEVFGYKFEGINKKVYPGYDVEDASSTVVKFKSGVVGNISCTWLWSGWFSGVEVVGQGITLTYEGTSVTVDRLKEKVTYTSSQDCMQVEDQSFIDAVRENDPKKVKSDYLDGLKTLAVTLAAHKSFETGQPVQVEV